LSNIVSDTSHRGDEYLLQLTAGLGWRLVATERARPWLDKMAGIMKLRKGNSVAYPKIIFCRKEFGKKTLKHLIASSDEKTRDGNGIFNHWSIRAKFKAVFELWVSEGRPDMIFDLGETGIHELEFLKMSEAVSEIFVHACAKDGIPLHAALVEHMGWGVILAAPSGTGKSTCARRIPAPWRALCDDVAIVIQNSQGRYLVHPFPTWSEYMWKQSTQTWGVEHHLPLSAVFFLEQAERDQVIPLEKAKAVVYMVRSASESLYSITDNYSPEARKHVQERVFLNACELAKAVPAYVLQVSLEGRFWEKMEEVLGETGLAEVV
jgi:SynChlorMet cassette protein ScmC